MEYDSIETSQFLIDFNPLIHKTLQRINIQQTHMDYDDYFQELQIHLLKIRRTYQNKDETNDEETNRYMFTAYASKGLYWRGINLIKKNNQRTCHSLEDEHLEWLNYETDQPLSYLHTQSDLYLEDFFGQARKRLTAEEYLLLMYLSDGQYNTDEIAELLQVTRSTVYVRKRKLQEKLEGIKNCLKD